ncbi:hypothetical protein ACTMTJ_05740 [Phytohabitans sp. LJ34]|uniref:hypothetical protein n=1 Tax=Phytohabitans sp. LJ34 TaxID=3452217 RepID=UPI003F89235E
MTDNQVLDALKDSFAGVRMNRPLEAVLARGRSRRRQRRAAAGGTLAVAAGLVAVAAAGVLGGAAPPAASEATPPQLASEATSSQLAAALSVVTDKHGTITVELRHPNDVVDPSALRHALTAARAPAIVRIGDCTWPSPGSGYGGEGFSMDAEGGRTIRITPSKLPNGAVVVFAIDGQLAPSGTTNREGRWVIIRAGVMAPGGTVTCKP